jgi:hypothetical protein
LRPVLLAGKKKPFNFLPSFHQYNRQSLCPPLSSSSSEKRKKGTSCCSDVKNSGNSNRQDYRPTHFLERTNRSKNGRIGRGKINGRETLAKLQ